MKITPEQAREALDAWICRPGMTQEQATILITEAFWALKERPNIDVQRVTYEGGAVDQRALSVRVDVHVCGHTHSEHTNRDEHAVVRALGGLLALGRHLLSTFRVPARTTGRRARGAQGAALGSTEAQATGKTHRHLRSHRHCC